MAKETKQTKQEMEKIAEEKRIAREIAYENSHFFVTWSDTDKNGKTIFKHDAITGSYDEKMKAVIFNIDMYNFTIAVDNLKGGVFLYSRCKTRESSSKYYRNSQYAKDVRKSAKEFMQVVLAKQEMTIDSLIAKAKNCKGFKENTREIVKDAIHMAHGRARTVYEHDQRKAEKQSANEETAKVV